jgi:hypothetical protein
VTVLQEGGHIAEIFDKRSGVNPLWIPPWPSIEPSEFNVRQHSLYGRGSDAKLLAGIMGHNLCLDIFGGPSEEELASGLTAHGEGSVASYEIVAQNTRLQMQAHLPIAGIDFRRKLTLQGQTLRISETVESRCSFDRPIGWTQHVTLGPPFLEKGATEFRLSAGRSKVFESDFGIAAYLTAGAEFEWPKAPRPDGEFVDLRVFNNAAVSSGYTAHLMDPQQDQAFFTAFSPRFNLLFGYVWKRAEFPWLGIWEENHSRTNSPWDGKTLTRGMEFGVSPMPESRRAMVDRGTLFGVPTYRWLPAKSRIEAEYCVVVRHVAEIPETLHWPV